MAALLRLALAGAVSIDDDGKCEWKRIDLAAASIRVAGRVYRVFKSAAV